MVKVYTSPTCAPCKQVKALFNYKNINYEEYDVTTSKDAQRALHELTGLNMVPVVVYGDTVISGYNPSMLADLVKSLQPSQD